MTKKSNLYKNLVQRKSIVVGRKTPKRPIQPTIPGTTRGIKKAKPKPELNSKEIHQPQNPKQFRPDLNGGIFEEPCSTGPRVLRRKTTNTRTPPPIPTTTKQIMKEEQNTNPPNRTTAPAPGSNGTQGGAQFSRRIKLWSRMYVSAAPSESASQPHNHSIICLGRPKISAHRNGMSRRNTILSLP
jgi:hypothetical protein